MRAGRSTGAHSSPESQEARQEHGSLRPASSRFSFSDKAAPVSKTTSQRNVWNGVAEFFQERRCRGQEGSGAPGDRPTKAASGLVVSRQLVCFHGEGRGTRTCEAAPPGPTVWAPPGAQLTLRSMESRPSGGGSHSTALALNQWDADPAPGAPSSACQTWRGCDRRWALGARYPGGPLEGTGSVGCASKGWPFGKVKRKGETQCAGHPKQRVP